MVKNVLATSVVALAFAIVTTIAFSGRATAGAKVKSTPAVMATTKQCHFPEDLKCPPKAEQGTLLDVGHDLTPDQLKEVDKMDFSDLCLKSIGECPKGSQ